MTECVEYMTLKRLLRSKLGISVKQATIALKRVNSIHLDRRSKSTTNKIVRMLNLSEIEKCNKILKDMK